MYIQLWSVILEMGCSWRSGKIKMRDIKNTCHFCDGYFFALKLQKYIDKINKYSLLIIIIN